MHNILFLIGTYPNYGGAEKVTTVLGNEFVKRGHYVSIASFEQPHPELKKLELDASIELLELRHPVYQKKNILVLEEFVRVKKIDCIINQWCLPYYITKLCKKVLKDSNCNLIAVHHNPPNKNARIIDLQNKLQDDKISGLKKLIYLKPKLFLTSAIIKRSMRYVYRKSDKYVVLSNSFIKIFSDFTGIKNPSKIEVIANPITIEENKNSLKKENVIIYVGRIDYNQKRVHRVIEFWEEVYKHWPTWKLEIIGDGPERRNLEAYVLNKNIANISFEGFQNPISYYKKSKILLLTSEYEGFGLVVIEAMNYGVTPIVYGSYSAVYDIIDDKKNGVILPIPYSQEKLVLAMKKLIGNEEVLKEMACNAKEKSKQFSLNKTMLIWEAFLRNL